MNYVIILNYKSSGKWIYELIFRIPFIKNVYFDYSILESIIMIYLNFNLKYIIHE